MASYNPDDSMGNRNGDCKREGYLDWNDYFMGVAFLSAKRSKDPCTQVGACVVDEMNRIVGVGYNGMPRGCNDDEFSWQKNTHNKLDSKFLYVCHAEVNAILNKNSHNLQNCTMYVGLFPCNECAKVIIQSGITRIFYVSDENSYKIETIAAKKMFDAASVEYLQYIPSSGRITIDFDISDWKSQNQMPSSPDI